MDEPTHSASWTGEGRDEYFHGWQPSLNRWQNLTTGADDAIGKPWVMTDAERSANAEWKPTKASPSVLRWVRCICLVLVSPSFLLIAWVFIHTASKDTIWQDHRGWMIAWTGGVF